jgi:glycosyltransferase involved in cell wall biosynthesis
VVEQIRPVTPRTRPFVSVVIPNYNYGHYLRDAATSALSQKDVDVDVIIIDNASTDSSSDVAASLADADVRVKCVLRTTNQGPIANFNEGLSYARGEYVVLLCADDLLAPGSLRRSTALLDSRPDVAFVYGHAPHFVDEAPLARTGVRNWSIWSGPEWVSRICRHGHSVIASPEVIMRRSVMSNLNYDTSFGGLADFKVWLDATRYGAVGRINGPDQGFYRIHASNLHQNEYDGWLTTIRSRARALEVFFREGHTELSVAGGERMDELWRRTLAKEALDGACRSYDRGRVVPADIDELEEFAISIYSGARELPEWRGLGRRKRVGASYAQYSPVFFATAVRRRLRDEIARRRWARGGEWV